MSNSESKKDINLIRGICLEGGGSTGVAHLGSLEILDNHDILPQLTHFIGSSAGSFVAAVLACRATIAFMRKILFDKDFEQLLDTSNCIAGDVWRLYRHFGYYKGDALEEWLGSILKELTGSAEITFEEVYTRFHSFLEVTVTDLFTGTEYINYLNNPKMMVKKALRRSASLPFVFKSDSEYLDTTFVRNDQLVTAKRRHYYVDGGLLDNYPIHRLYQYLPKESVIGIKLMSSHELHEISYPGIDDSSEPPANIVDFTRVITSILRNQALRLHVEEDDWERTIKIDVGTIASTDFKLSDDDKEFLIDSGRTAAKKFLNEYTPYQPQRALMEPEFIDIPLVENNDI